MSILQVLKQGTKIYHKAGYRLASVVSMSIPEQASKMGVETVRRATIQHISGKEKLVEIWLGKDGKAIKTIHATGENFNERIITDYKWSNPKVFKKGDWYDNYLKEDNPHVFENITGKIKRRVIVKSKDGKKFKEIKRTYTNLDINKKHQTITKSIGTIEEKFNTSEIYSIQDGKKTKWLKLKAEKQQDGTYRTISTDYFGVTKEDAQYIFSDEYFHSRFLPTYTMSQCCVAQAAKNQKLSYTPKFVKSGEADRNCANWDKTIGLSNSIINDTDIHANVVDMLNHESKHLKQYEYIEKLINGELTNPKEIEIAKQYKDNFENYINIDTDVDKYRAQLVEREAYMVGSKVRRAYFDVTNKLKDLFDFSSWHSIGA